MGEDDRFCDRCGAQVGGPDEPGPTVDDDDAATTGRPDAASREAGPDPAESALFPTDHGRSAEPARRVRAEAPRRRVQVGLDDEPTTAGAGPPTEIVALTGGVDLAACPTCGAVNAIQRRRCARCSATMLDDGAEGHDEPVPAASSDAPALPLHDDLPVASERRGLPRVGVALVVVVGAVVGAVLAAVAFGVGPFDRATGVGVAFDGDGYPGQAEPLPAVPSATTPVREAADGRTFTADQVVDDDLATAWVAVDGVDATLEFQFDRPVWVVAVEVGNGDQFDDETFASTARIRTLGVDFAYGSTIEATLLSGVGRQGFRPPEPVLTETITLDVMDTTEGVDVALSDITFVGFEANAADAQAFAEAE